MLTGRWTDMAKRIGAFFATYTCRFLLTEKVVFICAVLFPGNTKQLISLGWLTRLNLTPNLMNQSAGCNSRLLESPVFI
jgi:hypothetical protein